MSKTDIISIDSISQVHNLLGLGKPKHPLVSLLPIDDRMAAFSFSDMNIAFNLYQISLKSGIQGNITYGRNTYDFEEGSIVFSKPGQILRFDQPEVESDAEGWALIFHPDLIRRSTLGKKIEQYSFFSYEVFEALHLSDDEKTHLTELAEKIRNEYSQNIDRHSQNLIVSNIELMLDYCTRYYDRQFYTRTNLNQDIISKFESLLTDYYQSDTNDIQGLPTVTYCGEQLNMSPHYLSDLLKKETGKSAQSHIHEFVINLAKNRLLGSSQQVSQIGYNLGFEYPQHFSKLFKTHTGMSPKEYRKLQ